MKHLRSEKMSVANWIQVPDNPRQRDTERHLARAKHLLVESPAHSRVAMAVTPEGKTWKVDGHTRAMAWSKSLGFPPNILHVDVYEVRDAHEAAELYGHFDNQSAVETASDKVSGAFRELHWTPKSSALMSGGIVHAMKIADSLWRGNHGLHGAGRGEGKTGSSKINTYVLVAAWLQELKLLDGLDPNRKKFSGPIISAAVMTFRKFGAQATEFWRLYNTDAGEKLKGAIDPVEALSRLMMQTRIAGAISHLDVTAKALAAFEAYLAHRTYAGGIKGIDPTKFSDAGLSEATDQKQNRKHKLTIEEVRAIRAEPIDTPARLVAARFKVSTATIYNIRNGESWYNFQ